MTNSNTVAVSIEFSFEQGATPQDLKKIAKKVNTVRKNSHYQTVVAYFAHHNTIEVIITFIDIDNKIFDKMRSPLYRLIDSHKEPATYGWSLDSSRISDLAVA